MFSFNTILKRFLVVALLSSSVNATEFITRTNNTGFYKISHQELAKHGLDKLSMGELKLVGKKGVKPYLFTSHKSKLKPTDDVVFFAEMLHGEHTYQHPLDDFNGFTVSKITKKRNNDWKEWQYQKKAFKNLKVCENILTTEHHENNKLLIRINAREFKQAPELWYWAKLNQLNKEGFSVPLDFSKLARKQDVQLKAVFRSSNVDMSAKDMPHHEVKVLFNGTVFTTLNWDKRQEYRSEKMTIPAELIKDKDNQLTFLVPKRKAGKKTIIDIVLLDYFELSYSINPKTIEESDQLSSTQACAIKLDKNQLAFDAKNNKYGFASIKLEADANVHITSMDKVKPLLLNPKRIIADDLAKIDYLMIIHPLFKQSIQQLAKFHRAQNTSVAVVDVEAIYDNYSHGVRELYAIKDFIKAIYNAGDKRLKHVLLVGDSSWDWRDNGKTNQYGKWSSRIMGGNRNFTNFPHQKQYTAEKFDRNFVPTGQYHSSEGHSASDNWFVSIVPEENIKGDDYIPDLAIGRFPASTPTELDAMIAKTINYAKNSKVGPWKSRILWITNADKRFQNSSKRTAKEIGKYGVMAKEVFPKEMDGDNLKIRETLSDSFDSGDLIVHFLGHGGKSIWRVGPPDLKNNRDLFTLDQVANLKNSKQLPFVMSMSCYSAPFDHPFADSIGEKFIREPEVGAVAVLAASWRNSPNSNFSRHVIDTIFKHPEFTIGQAVLEGKRYYKGKTMVEMYNLLGDPALHLAIPSLKMSVENHGNKVDLSIEKDVFIGKAKIDIIDKDAEVISSKEIEVNSPTFSIDLDEKESSCFQGRIYAWDSKQNIDAMASFTCEEQLK